MDEERPEQRTPFDLPGLNLSVFFQPRRDWHGLVCGHAIDVDDIEVGLVGYTFTLRELLMMRIMNSITDKPDWDTKVFNDEIVSKWRSEILQGDHDVTTAMMDYMIQELQWKATKYQNTGIVTAYDTGVVKSDIVIPKDLQQRLREAVNRLEAASEMDYHPGSDMKVVDLVHPSLFPLIYGRSRVLRDTIIGVEDCFSSTGQGELLELPNEQQLAAIGISAVGPLNPYSATFQWLPCNVEFTPDGQARIASYINNLHPTKHSDLYKIIEEVLTRTISLWNISLSCKNTFEYRIPVEESEYVSDEPKPQNETPGVYSEAFRARRDAWLDRRRVKIPEPGQFEPPKEKPTGKADLHAQFKDKGLQVIVKLANIELTPERPEYEGGSWHIEGQLNERICATAIYYYDSHNITDNTLSFRNRADEEYIREISYEQGQFQYLSLFGFNPEDGHRGTDNMTQDLGGVSCREGRLLTFPNILQHRVSPFSLADRSKPGHRKILAFFLIDPNRRIISTANVPPQREDWCDEWKNAINEGLSSRFPVELQEMVRRHCDFGPMTMDEAKAYRLELMDERSAYAEKGNGIFEAGDFNLCEH